jgi:hypothetical protein
MVSCTNKGKVRQELDQIQKRKGAAHAHAPSGLKLNIPEPIRIIYEDELVSSGPPPRPAKR